MQSGRMSSFFFYAFVLVFSMGVVVVLFELDFVSVNRNPTSTLYRPKTEVSCPPVNAGVPAVGTVAPAAPVQRVEVSAAPVACVPQGDGPSDKELKERYIKQEKEWLSDYPNYSKVVHIVSHTHWDREWYLSFERYRRRFVWLLDDVFDRMKRDGKRFKHFHMDGQIVPYLDFLQIRPEMQSTIIQYVKEGRFSFGPWYTAPDEFLASGEALVRNMLNAFRYATKWGVECDLVGYMADQFGHVSQIPQLYRGFGIDNVVMGRGLQGNTRSEAIWKSPDGSKALVIYMTAWYCNGEGSPSHPSQATGWFRNKMSAIEGRATTKHLLVMAGCDHTAMDPSMLNNIDAANKDSRSLGNALFINSNMKHYIKVVKQELGDSGMKRLAETTGELRVGIKGLSHIGSNKITQKQANWLCMTLLEHYAEPLRSFTWAKGLFATYDVEYFWYAWEYILQNHAHDSIGGCSVPDVHKDVDHRFYRCQQVAQQLADESLMKLARNIDPAKGSKGSGSGRSNIVVVNTLNFPRSEVVLIRYDTGDNARAGDSPKVYDSETGEAVPAEIINSDGDRWDYALPNHGFRRPMNVKRHYLALQAKNVPAMGYKTFRVESLSGGPAGRPVVSAEGQHLAILENDLVRVGITARGTFDLTDKKRDKTYSDLNKLVTVGDHGDEYNFQGGGGGSSPDTGSTRVGNVETGAVGQRVSVETTLNGNAIVITYFLPVDSSLVEIRTSIHNHARNFRLRAHFNAGVSPGTVRVDGHFDVLTRRTSTPGEGMPAQDWVDLFDKSSGVGLTVANRGLPEYEIEGTAIAITLIRATGRMGDWGTFPSSPSSQEPGQLHFEYAVTPHSSGHDETVAPDNDVDIDPETNAPFDEARGGAATEPGAVGFVPSSQLKGRAFAVPMVGIPMVDYPGVMPSRPLFDLRKLTLAQLEQDNSGNHAAVQAEEDSGGGGWGGGGAMGYSGPEGDTTLAAFGSFLDLSHKGQLVMSAVKVTETRAFNQVDGGTLLVRFYNPRQAEVQAKLSFPGLSVKEAYLVNLREERLGKLTISDGAVVIPTGGKKIISVELVLDR